MGWVPFPVWIFYDSAITNTLVSPLQTRLYLHSFIQWLPRASCSHRAFTQGLHCHKLAGLSCSTKAIEEKAITPSLLHQSYLQRPYNIGSAAKFEYQLVTDPSPLNHFSNSFCVQLLSISRKPCRHSIISWKLSCIRVMPWRHILIISIQSRRGLLNGANLNNYTCFLEYALDCNIKLHSAIFHCDLYESS